MVCPLLPCLPRATPTVVIHPVPFDHRQYLLDISRNPVDIQLAFNDSIKAEDEGAIIPFHLFGIRYLKTGAEQFNGQPLQTVQLLASKVVLNPLKRLRIAAVGHQFINDSACLFAPFLHIRTHAASRVLGSRRCGQEERVRSCKQSYPGGA